METKKQPIHKIKSGAITIAIWRNEGPDGPFYNSTVSRTFLDSENKVRSTDSLRKKDNLVAAHLRQKAYDWIDEQEARDRERE